MKSNESHLEGPHYLAFTTTEGIAVFLVITIALSVIVPAVARAREGPRGISCLANLREFSIATAVYAGDYGGSLPPWVVTHGRFSNTNIDAAYSWQFMLFQYLGIDYSKRSERNGIVDMRGTNGLRVFQCAGQDCTSPPENALGGTAHSNIVIGGVPTGMIGPRVSYICNSIFAAKTGPATQVVFGIYDDTHTTPARPSAKITQLAAGTMLYEDADVHDNPGDSKTGADVWPDGGTKPAEGGTVGQHRTCTAFCSGSSTYCNQYITLTNHEGRMANFSFADGSARSITKQELTEMKGGPTGSDWLIKDQSSNNGNIPILQIVIKGKDGSTDVIHSTFFKSQARTVDVLTGSMFSANP